MNDRFKFRVWDKGNEHYVDYADLLYIEPSGEITYACYDGDREDMYYYEQDDVVIEQCTGLRDKNGKLIFEGDIVKTEWFDEKTIYQVVWDEKMACFCFDGKNIFYLFDDLPADVTEIIGNIHEKPEMLEQSNDD